jgi:hypothetical protein
MVSRALKPLCHPRCRTLWLARHRMDDATPEALARHLAKVRRRLAAISR